MNRIKQNWTVLVKAMRFRAVLFSAVPSKAVLFNIGLMITGLVLSSCGRYGAVLAPEALSPKAVQDLKVTPDAVGVTLSWESPQNDRRAKELKSLDGYQVFQVQLQPNQDIGSEGLRYVLLTSIEDKSVVDRERRRDEARAQGKPARRIKQDESLTSFTYRDESLQPGGTYVYRIVPVNQGGTGGEVRQLVKIRFKGEASDVEILTDTTFDPDVSIE